MKRFSCWKKFLFIVTIILLFPCFSFAVVDTSSLVIESPSVILVHADTGTILYEKDAHRRMYPASTTKIMTAILVLESGHDLFDLVTVSNEAVSSIPEGYVDADLQPGEQFTVEELLNVLLIPSANDAANVLAEYISGSVSAFAEKMNEKALELGCLDTHFVNPNGVHSEDHYSTAYDLSLIGRYAMQNQTFRNFVARTSCSLPNTEKYTGEVRKFTTTNQLLIPNDSADPDNYYYPYAIGVKTGFTTPAGSCLVAASSHNDLEFIAVILGGDENEAGISQRFSDTKKLFRFAYTNYLMLDLKHKDDVIQRIQIKNATSNTKDLSVLCDRTISAFVELEKATTVSPVITLNENLMAPISQGDVIGNLRYDIMGISYEANLVAGSNVEKEVLFPLLLKIIATILFVTAIILSCFTIWKWKKN